MGQELEWIKPLLDRCGFVVCEEGVLMGMCFVHCFEARKRVNTRVLCNLLLLEVSITILFKGEDIWAMFNNVLCLLLLTSTFM